jgi:cell division protein FtsZ
MQLHIVEEGRGTGFAGCSPTVIKVIGVGGGGNNAINRMIDGQLSDVEFIAFNTDLQALSNSRAHIRESLGAQTTKGLGAGGNPEVGERAALEDKDKIKKLLDGADMVFITSGMGGGTGTGAAPVIAQIAREMGILCVACVTAPFDFEGDRKRSIAQDGIRRLRDVVDSLIVIPNQHLLKISDRRTSVKQSFLMADDVLRQGVQGISDLITKSGEINIDFADVRAVMEGQGDAIMGIGFGEGDSRAVDAAMGAINNPLLQDANIEGATGVLVNVLCSSDFPLPEYQEIMNIITANSDPEAKIKSGIVYDDSLGEKVQVTVIATGFRQNELRSGQKKPGAAVYGKEGLGELFASGRPSQSVSQQAMVRGNSNAPTRQNQEYQSQMNANHTQSSSAAANLNAAKEGPNSFDDIIGPDLGVPTFLRNQSKQNAGARK